MLFLAVTGALAAGVLGGSSVAINNQRYVDAVNSFKALVQGEVVAATRVVNESDGTATCIWNQLYSTPSSSQPVGTSDCILMGRAIAVKDGQTITTANIVGKSNTDATYAGDVEAINAYQPVIDTTNQKTSVLNWDTHIQNNESFVIYVFRSPQSGNIIIRTQRSIGNTDVTSGYKIGDISNSSFNSDRQEVCIDASGWTAAQQQAIIINKDSSGPTGIEQLTGQPGC
jgi:hypothetical protein